MDFESALQAFQHLYARTWVDAEPNVANGAFRIRSAANLRPKPGNQPAILHHGTRQRDVVILIHGITDSPYYVQAIGERFHREGFNVVLPLLPAHGLKKPWPAMRKLRHTDWIADVDEITSLARGLGDRVSMGGFSTGGALTIRKVANDGDAIDGGLFLFSAALEIGQMLGSVLEGPLGPVLGRLIDVGTWARAGVGEIFSSVFGSASQRASDDSAYGIGDDPYKYSVFFVEGAAELAKVIDEIDSHYQREGVARYSTITQPVFAAHSRTDTAAMFSGVERLIDHHPDERKALYAIADLPHPSVVLAEPILDATGQQTIVEANPQFGEMTDAMIAFTRTYVTDG